MTPANEKPRPAFALLGLALLFAPAAVVELGLALAGRPQALKWGLAAGAIAVWSTPLGWAVVSAFGDRDDEALKPQGWFFQSTWPFSGLVFLAFGALAAWRLGRTVEDDLLFCVIAGFALLGSAGLALQFRRDRVAEMKAFGWTKFDLDASATAPGGTVTATLTLEKAAASVTARLERFDEEAEDEKPAVAVEGTAAGPASMPGSHSYAVSAILPGTATRKESESWILTVKAVAADGTVFEDDALVEVS